MLHNLNLDVYPGDFIHIRGTNGCGKSTLLKIISGLLVQDSGEVEKAEALNIGALIENPSFPNDLTAKECLEFLYGIKNDKVDRKKIEELCRRLELDYFNKKKIKTYSLGMKQKLGIIQAVMEEQNLILLDEPYRGLDTASLNHLMDLLLELKAQGKAIIVASHDLTDIPYTARYQMQDGTLVQV